LIFFGVPHAGGDHAAVRLGTLATKIAQTVLPGASKDIMETLKDGSMYTDILKAMFRNHLERFEIVSFYERVEQAGLVNSPSLLYPMGTLTFSDRRTVRERHLGVSKQSRKSSRTRCKS
jgi:hypothetical protein